MDLALDLLLVSASRHGGRVLSSGMIDCILFDIVYTAWLQCTVLGVLYTSPVIVRVARVLPVHRDYISLCQDLASSLILTPPELDNIVLQGR